MRGPRAGWGALTAAPAARPASPRATPRPGRKVRGTGSLSLSPPAAPRGRGRAARHPGAGSPAGLCPEPAPAPARAPPPPPAAGRPETQRGPRLPTPRPLASPAGPFRPRVRPSGGTRPAPLSGGASRRLLPLAGPSLSARSGEVCTSSPRSGARAKSETQRPTAGPAAAGAAERGRRRALRPGRPWARGRAASTQLRAPGGGAAVKSMNGEPRPGGRRGREPRQARKRGPGAAQVRAGPPREVRACAGLELPVQHGGDRAGSQTKRGERHVLETLPQISLFPLLFLLEVIHSPRKQFSKSCYLKIGFTLNSSF